LLDKPKIITAYLLSNHLVPTSKQKQASTAMENGRVLTFLVDRIKGEKNSVRERSKGQNKQLEEETHNKENIDKNHTSITREKKTGWWHVMGWWRKWGVGYKLVDRLDAPPYMQDNPFILTSYRCNFPLRLCFYSLVRIHNQTGNIWSHLFGFVLFIFFTIYTYTFLSASPPHLASVDAITTNLSTIKPTTLTTTDPQQINPQLEDETFILCTFMIFLCSAILSMATSTCYHLLQAHSKEVWLRFLQLDLSSVALVIAGSFYPPVYMIFYADCYSHIRWFYLPTISLLSVIGGIGPMWPPFNTPRFLPLRVSLYSSLAFFSLIPSAHICILFGWDLAGGTLMRFGISVLFYTAGVLFYSSKFPEKRWPGKFDIWGHSHTLWHICCLLGEVQHFFTCWYIYSHWKDFASTCPTSQ
jgi:adiponectin receptor